MKIPLSCLLPVALLALVSPAATQQPISGEPQPTTEEDVLEHIAVLASDEFAGRNPGTIGEVRTLEYLAEQWARAGMVSGTNDPSSPWFQPVPLVERTPAATSARFMRGGRVVEMNRDGILLGADMAEASASGPVIFVGYGTDAAGRVTANVDGKIAIMLFSPPEGAEDFPSRNDRRAALAGAGAVAALTVAPDRFLWRAIQRSIRSGSFELDQPSKAPAVTGIINGDFARRLFRGSESSLKAEIKAAESPVYAGFDTGLTAELNTLTQLRRFTSHNVIGKFEGRKPGSGAVLLLGHWDHFGICRDAEAEDRICNGAVDNASGMAVLTEVAEELGRLGPFDRDIYFMGTTAEERGLLGAYYFADNPVVPLEDIVIALNIDTVAIAERGAPVAIIGRGETDLDDEIDAVSRSLGREVEESLDANAFIQRQDGWALAAKGVPAFMVGGSFADLDLLQSYLRGNYHGPDDETENLPTLGGAAEDTDLHIALARYFADAEKYSPE
ncbi:MAG: M28 family peptidase [Pseudomonadota bacterium]